MALGLGCEPLELFAERFGRERLNEVIRNAGLNRFQNAIFFRLRRYHDDRHLGIDRPDFAGDFEAGVAAAAPMS